MYRILYVYMESYKALYTSMYKSHPTVSPEKTGAIHGQLYQQTTADLHPVVASCKDQFRSFTSPNHTCPLSLLLNPICLISALDFQIS